MTRGEVRIAHVGHKHRPVLVLTRTDVIDVRALVTVAEITTSIRGIGAEVLLDPGTIGVERRSAINCDGIHTVTQKTLKHRVGQLNDTTMQLVCSALNCALGC
ncbi:MAG TPA: type II toxin-antitoxin system PemK/MazF family toxin [Ilumatobacteraceae bacterium]|nr:type II toxin-antitoxin system PemK/MazF family toxin [Ilumatobacteraceae bacterium]